MIRGSERDGRKTISVALLALALLALLVATPAAHADFEITGFDGSTNNQDGSASTQAGEHPFDATTSFSISSGTDSFGSLTPEENPRDVEVRLPAGFVGNPTAAPKCTAAQLANSLVGPPFNECPVDSQVGFAEIDFTLGGPKPTLMKLPVYNMVTPVGSPALLGFNVLQFVTFLHAHVRTGEDYGVTAELSPVSQATPFIGGSFVLWGVPADSSHNGDREKFCIGATCAGGGVPSSAPRKPFLTNPMNCSAGPLSTFLRIDSWQNIGHFEEDSFVSHLPDGTPTGVEGCSRLAFDPSIAIQPTSSAADSPTGLSVNLGIPQNESADGLAEAYLKKATVTLPAGLAIDPAAADGLVGCSSTQVDLKGPGAAQCPNASKIGSVEVDTPLLDHPVKGSVYAAAQKDNPFNSLLATYIAIDDPQTGVVVKLAGHVVTDPNTGQLTATFDENPQLPFSNFELNFFGGPRAVLQTPPTCGTYTSSGKFSPWSAVDPNNPTPAETVTSVSSFKIDQGPNGGPCPVQGFDPKLNAGTVNPVAGSYTPMSLQLTRSDGTQRLKELAVTPPPGLLGKLAGIPYCPDNALASIPTAEGTGAAQLTSPSCPAGSLVGTVSVGAGSGPSPLFVNTGRAYLAGPYEGAPLSLAIVTPALAGPFDLGNVMVRTALHVDPETVRLTAVSDPLPTILDGVPLDLRDVRVNIDRSQFTLNPTSCDPMSFTGTASSVQGAMAALSNRFQVGSCGSLGFKPKLALSLKGGTGRGHHPSLRAVLTMPKGGANIGRAQVALPHSEFLDQNHIKTVCTRVQFTGHECPVNSVYGRARAITPLLDQPLEGPVYLRSSSHKLPDLVADLNGQIHVVLDGRIDSVNGGIRSTFAAVPDAPVSKFVLEMQGGKRGLLQNSTNLCLQPHHATAKFDGQNGKVHDFAPLLSDRCHG
jgi:hypothetical protein